MKFTYSLYFQVTVILILLSIFTAAGVGTLNYLESRKIIISQFSRSMQDVASTIGSSLSTRTDDAANAIMRISSNKLLVSQDHEEIQKFLQIAVESSSLFNNIYFFAPTGELIALAYADGRDLSIYAGENFNNYADQEKTRGVYLDLVRALETRTPVFSAFFQSYTGRLMNSFIVPVVYEDGVVGLLSCGIVLDNTSKLLDQMEKLKPQPNGFIALVDNDSRILLQAGSVPEGLSIKPDRSHTSGEPFKEFGYLLSIFNLPKTELGICIGLPESSVYELLSNLRKGTQLFTVAVSFFASLLGILAAYVFISPINDLVTGLKQLNEGKPGARINRRASGEIAEAISIYNQMNDRLRKEKSE